MVKLFILIAGFCILAAGKSLVPCNEVLPGGNKECCDLPIPYMTCLNECGIKSLLSTQLSSLLKCLSTDHNKCLHGCLVQSSNGTLTLSDSYLSDNIRAGLNVMIEDEVQFSTVLDTAIPSCQKIINNTITANPLGCSTEDASGALLLCVIQEMIKHCPKLNIISPK